MSGGRAGVALSLELLPPDCEVEHVPTRHGLADHTWPNTEGSTRRVDWPKARQGQLKGYPGSKEWTVQAGLLRRLSWEAEGGSRAGRGFPRASPHQPHFCPGHITE